MSDGFVLESMFRFFFQSRGKGFILGLGGLNVLFPIVFVYLSSGLGIQIMSLDGPLVGRVTFDLVGA